MSNVIATFLFVYLTQTHAKEVATSAANAVNSQLEEMVETMADNLFARTLKVSLSPGQSMHMTLVPRAGLARVAGVAGPALPQQKQGFLRGGQPALPQRTGVVVGATVKKGQVFEVTQPKPIGVNFKKGADGGIYVSRVDKRADERIQVGDKLLAVSASFGSEVWPAKEYQQTMMAINTRVGQVYMKLESVGGGKASIFGFGKKDVGPTTEYVCLDCGWVYRENKGTEAFKDLSIDFVCPQCSSTKNRFARKNPETGELEKQFDIVALGTTVTVVGGLVGVVVLAYLALNP